MDELSGSMVVPPPEKISVFEMIAVLVGAVDGWAVSVALNTGVLSVAERVGVAKADELSMTEVERTTVGSLVAVVGKTMLELDTLNRMELVSSAEVPFTGAAEILSVAVAVTKLVSLTLTKPVVTIPVTDRLSMMLTELGTTALSVVKSTVSVILVGVGVALILRISVVTLTLTGVGVTLASTVENVVSLTLMGVGVTLSIGTSVVALTLTGVGVTLASTVENVVSLTLTGV